MWRDATGFVGAAVSYVGDREGPFTGAPGAPGPRQGFPGYAKTDLHAGLKIDSWKVDLFANNVTNRRGVLDGGYGYFYPPATIYITPRTVGINVVKSF